MQINSIIQYQYTHIRMAKVQKLTTPSAGEDVEQQELILLVGTQNGPATLEDSFLQS